MCGFKNLVFVVNLDDKHIKQTTCFEYFPVLKQSSAVVRGVYGQVQGNSPSLILNSIFENGKLNIQINNLYLKYYQELIEKKMSGYSVFKLAQEKLPGITSNLELLHLIKDNRRMVIDTNIEVEHVYKQINFILIPGGNLTMEAYLNNQIDVQLKFCKLINDQKVEINKNTLLVIYSAYSSLWKEYETTNKCQLYSIMHFFDNDGHWMKEILINYCKEHYYISSEEVDISNTNKAIQANLIDDYLFPVNYRQVIRNITSFKKLA